MMTDVHQPKADQPSYNQAFEKIVDSEEDVIGLFAYALYKQHKRDWIVSHKAENGTEPSEIEKSAFMRSQLLAKTVESYRQRASEILGDYTNQVVEQAKPQHFKEALTDRVELALGYWRGVWTGMSAAFFYTLVLILFSIILRYAGVDWFGILKAVSYTGS